MPATECLDANAVQDLMSGSLDSTARATAFSHLDECADCRDLIGILARESVQNSAEDTMHRRAAAIAAVTLPATAPSGGLINPSSAAIVLPTGLATTAAAAVATTAASTPPTASMSMPRVHEGGKIGDGETRKLGRYQLLAKLGSGAMGVVYRATDAELDRDVALKLLKRPDASLTDRLIREARSMAKVSHPNVVGVYDVGVADGVTYIAMELVQGESLRAWQTTTKRAISEIVEVYLAAGRGLAAAHAAGIIHRDFKPDNVLVSSDGRIRVTDFGLAAAAVTTSPAQGDAITDVDLTASGSVLGTPAYMAPEQFTGGNVDPRTDQFNYSVALYEALYGHRPFAGKSFEELGDNVCDGKIRPPPAGTQVSNALRAILLRGLSIRPGDRYPTMDDLLVELGRDRARPWRYAALGSTALAIALGIGLVADWAIRDRIERQIEDAFLVTGKQVDGAVDLLKRKFVVASNVAYVQPQIKDVCGSYDSSDFGLGSESDDVKHRTELHDILSAADWESWTRELKPGPLAITDRGGRLLYASRAPDVWDKEDDKPGAKPRPKIAQLATVKELITRDDNAHDLQVLRADAPELVASGVLGKVSPDELWVMFARAIAPNKKVGAMYLQFSSANEFLRDIKIDEATLLAFVAPDGTYVSEGTMPAELVAGAQPFVNREVREVRSDGTSYQIMTIPIPDDRTQQKPVAHVMMARRMSGVLSGLFPGARLVFAFATGAALAFALATTLRARKLTGARRT